MKRISITEIDGFRLGNAENSEKGTGCTVIICEDGAVGGVDVRGGGPATRETDLLRSENTVNAVNAVVLSGGSAFGLEAASGVMRELADRGIGFNAGDDIFVPIVCGASLYDLPVGDSKAFPDVNMGIQAVHNAYSGSFATGNHGAGTGATVGKLKGYDRAMKSGLGSFACGDGIVEVGAIAAVNAVGDIYNGAGKIIAGLRSEDGESIYGTIKTLKGMVHDRIRLVDDSTSFINKYDIEEALAAAARQYEEEEAAAEEAEASAEPVEETVEEAAAAAEPVEETAEETAAAEDPAEETVEETAAIAEQIEETAEEPAEETAEEISVAEEPAEETEEETASVSEPVEVITEETDVIEEQIEEIAEEPEEEFIPETPPANSFGADHKGYDEISIPVESAEDLIAEPAEGSAGDTCDDETEETSEEVHEETDAGSAEEPDEEPVELTREEMGYDIVFNTTISCLITNASLTKSQANKLASILHDAYARAIKPVHGTLDGDTIFVLSTGKQEVNFDAFAALATDVMQYAVIDGAMSAEGAYGLPCAKDMQK